MAEPDSKLKDPSFGEPVQQVSSTAQGETLKHVDDRALDEAARYLATTEEYGPMTPEMEKKIVKKIDAWMIPLVCLDPTVGGRTCELTESRHSY